MINYEDNIGSNIRTVREKIGLSQSKLADKCGISNTMLSNYETGKKTPGLITIANIARCLNVSIERLYYGDENETFITSETDMGRKIVNALYFLWDSGLISYYEKYEYETVLYDGHQKKDLKGAYLVINNYVSQIRRLISSLNEFKANIKTYDEPDKYLEYILSSVAKDINNCSIQRKEALEEKLKQL